jgi:DNA polymerase-4
LIQLARGIEAAPVTPQTPVKSISGEETLETDTRDKRKLQIYLMQHAEDVGHRLRQANMKARRVTLKIKHSDFKQVTRSKTMKQGTNVSEIIYREAKQLLDHYHLTRPVRLIGMGVSALTETDHPVQRALFDSEGDRTNPWQQVDQVMDAITEKFGKGSISKARLKEDDP